MERGSGRKRWRRLRSWRREPVPLARVGHGAGLGIIVVGDVASMGAGAGVLASVYDWGTLGLATQARLLAARALAETGQFERALRSLQFVLLSPRTVGAREGQLWATRVAVAALAGDRDDGGGIIAGRASMRVPRRRFARFAAYWRGRCALARGEFRGGGADVDAGVWVDASAEPVVAGGGAGAVANFGGRCGRAAARPYQRRGLGGAEPGVCARAGVVASGGEGFGGMAGADAHGAARADDVGRCCWRWRRCTW